MSGNAILRSMSFCATGALVSQHGQKLEQNAEMQKRKFDDVTLQYSMWEDFVILESNIMPRFLVSGEGSISALPVVIFVSTRRCMLWEEAAMKILFLSHLVWVCFVSSRFVSH